jgi:hypothetical protein
MSRLKLLASIAVLSVSVSHAQPQPVATHWQAIDAAGPVDVSGAQRLSGGLQIGLADGSGTNACPAGVWTGQATFTGGADGTLTWWGTGFGCAPHGVGTLQYADGSSYFGRVTSYFAGPGLPLRSATFRPAVPDGPGQLYTPSTRQQRLGRFTRGSFSTDLATDPAFVAAYQAAYDSVIDRGAPVWTPAIAQLFAAHAAGAAPAAKQDGDVGARLFPAHLPRRPEFDQVEKWAARVGGPDWESEARAVLDPKDGSVKGWRLLKTMFGDLLSDCAKVGKQGTIVVDDGGKLADGFKRYRGGWGGCGPAGNGIIEYADGKRYIGQVSSAMSPGTTLNYTTSGLGLWQYPNGRSALIKGGRGLLAFGAPGEWWAEGEFDGQWNAADGAYHAADGSEFRGVLKDGRPGGKGMWQDPRSGLQVGGDALHDEQGVLFKGAIQLALAAPVALPAGGVLPAGRYDYESKDGWRPSAPLPVEALIPAAATLAQPVSRGACSVAAKPPEGWRVWWPSCRSGADGVEVASYSPDRNHRMVHRATGATLHELEPAAPQRARRTWVAGGFSTSNPPAPYGEAKYYEGDALVFEGRFAGLSPDGAGLCAVPAGEGRGMEPCEFRAGNRVDQLHHLRQQRLALQQAQQEQQRRQEAARLAEQQRIAALQAQQRQAAAAAAAAQEKQGGFQWGKFAALATGAAAGGLGKLDTSTQMDVLGKIAMDSMAGNEGISNLQSLSTASATPSLGGLGGGTGGSQGAAGGSGGGQGAVPAGSYPARPNTLDGHPACSGYSVSNYKEYFAQNSSGPDAQLHSMCAAAYNYYWMYLNAIRQGYSQADSDRTYAAFSDAARVATGFHQSAR